MDSQQLTVQSFLYRLASVFGDREVITHGVADLDRVTYSVLLRRVHRLAHVLQSLGVSRGDRVATLGWNHQRHLEVYLAVPSSGAVLHTINLRLAAPQIADIIDHAGDKVLFIDPGLIDLARDVLVTTKSVRKVVVMSASRPPDAPAEWHTYEELLAGAPAGDFTFPADLSENETAATCYSSATTGRPKGVIYSHRALYLHTMMLAMADTWALCEADTIMPIVPMFHVNAWGLPYAAAFLGSGLVLPGPAPSAEAIVDLITAHRVTFAAAVPTVWAGVFDTAEKRGVALPSLRMAVCGGSAMPAVLLTRAGKLGVPLVHAYGMTEASPLVLVSRIKSTLAGEPSAVLDNRRLRQGLLVPGLEMAVVRDSQPVAWDGQSPGELLLRGPWVAEAYERDDRSADAFAAGWYRSGDIVNVDGEGYVAVVDRQSDLIKSGGEWISSIDLENALMDVPGVRAATVISVPHAKWGERPAAFIVAPDDVTDDRLRDHLRQRFPRWWIPDHFVRIKAIPLTSTGKYDKKLLRQQWNN